MRGSPLLRAGCVVLALLALLVPLRSLTRPPVVAAPAAAPSPTAASLHLAAAATALPARIAVTHLGREIWATEITGPAAETTVDLPFPAEGIDLGLAARWAPGVAGAVKLTVTPADGEPLERLVWGDGTVDEVLTFRP